MTTEHSPRTARRRALVDGLLRVTVTTGGLSVVVAIVVVLIYLIWMVMPIFLPATVEHVRTEPFDSRDVLLATTDAHNESLAAVTRGGSVRFLDARSLETQAEVQIYNGSFLSVKPIFPRSNAYAAKTNNNELIFFRVYSVIRTEGNQRFVRNQAELLFDGSTIRFDEGIFDFDVFQDESKLRIVVLGPTLTSSLREYKDVDDDFVLSDFDETRLSRAEFANQVLFGPQGRYIYELNTNNGRYRVIAISSIDKIEESRAGEFTSPENKVVAIAPVLGRNSFLVSDHSGKITQWSLLPARTDRNFIPIREFDVGEVIHSIESEKHRKGFIALAANGNGHLAHTTSNSILATFSVGELPKLTVLSPRADQLTAFGEKEAHIFAIDNEHPELTFTTLFKGVLYEGYSEPTMNWQSSSADTAYEAKYSLVPLLVGTVKTAFFAMLFGIPLAIFGAIYTAMFMTRRMRRFVKPVVEMLESLPTVVIGFIAGLWFAPIVEAKLTSILLLTLFIPISIVLVGFVFSRLPEMINDKIENWRELICVPIVITLGSFVLGWDTELSQFLFGTDIKLWLYEIAGIEYEQRNAFIIGMAMGLAIIPTIFSIADDAIHNVPVQLVRASVALGATRWQTMSRVVLFAASGGIFTAVMIGLSKAVGETMIVLMASGNSPILDFSPFEGMRTLTANIAIEMPETEVGSTHFRILILLALLLFAMTFTFNTLADNARRRWRLRYAQS